ncbi:MAG: cytochrome b/b6 domain-containing protein [Planctomycetota bacterium]|jgi:cytochrome b subunit of formate dehydrogenase
MSNTFQTISIIGFVVTFAGIAIPCIAASYKGYKWRPEQIVRKLIHLFTLLFVEQRLSLVGVLRKLVFLLALLCFVVLAITGFYPTLVLGKHISGYLLMLHATFAMVFAICLAVLAVMWASHCRFNENDWPGLQHFLERITLAKNAGEEPLNKSGRLGQKITFWLLVMLALPLILSMVSSMFPLFGTNGQKLLLELHRYSALLFTMAAIN